MEDCMARKNVGFNLSAVIRVYRKAHPAVSANDALDAVKKSHSSRKINEGTFRATFYKLAGSGRRKKSVRRRRPDRSVVGGNDHTDATMRAGLTFVRLAGGVKNAQEHLVGLGKLIETAKALD
jgi:hypothetical protein